ncbi:hypothetical protein ACH6EH_16910 [Paenibacillus sp. JSM ZJ436]|uniref:hypothetical protein n=1 Tax=Paenibacillus sp. JSM ZJ436 TaxID=3376190 RepID=UPI0037B981D4
MGKVIQLKPKSSRFVMNNRQQSVLNQAFRELQRETGIDFSKVISGDEKEKKRLKFKQQQERLLEG